MLHNHHATLARLGLNKDLKYLVRDYFSLAKNIALMPALLARGLGQADLVLCLLRLRDSHVGLRPYTEMYITLLVGHPILIGPGCLLLYRCNGPAHAALDSSPKVTYVTPTNPRQPNTEAFLRWPEYKLGRTTAQLRARGVKAKDIRHAVKNGWIKLEEHA